MGQKVHPIGFRLGVNKTWSSRWFSRHDYAKLLREDIRIRKYIFKKFESAGVANVDIERAAKNMKINIFSSRPGIIIGKKGACLLYTSPSPRDKRQSRMPSSA